MVTTTPSLGADIRFLEALFGPAMPKEIGVRFWEGTTWPDERPRAAVLVLKHPGALHSMFRSGTENGLAEAYVRDDFDVEGDFESALQLADVLHERQSHWLTSLRTFFFLHRLPSAGEKTRTPCKGPRHSPENDRRAVSFHYDVSNEFFHLWLDERMVYSCAYFEREDSSLDQAQEAKLELICRKLRLRPGQTLLDIGCGWGGLAIHAARYHGARVTGITLSVRQREVAIVRVHAAGLSDRVEIQLRDYRELSEAEQFDAIASVGMSEHVGSENLDVYFKQAHARLKPGGVFLNHAIGEGVRPRGHAGPSFIDEHVFPASELPPIPAVVRAAEAAGLEIRDVENLREHYALTLRHWARRLEAAHAAALTHVDEATYRTWRLYLMASAHGFTKAHFAVYQTLLSKTDAAGRSHLPLTRRTWYT